MKKSLSLLELQKVRGFLNFVSTVVPLGRTFLRRLSNIELYFSRGIRHAKRPLSREAHKDLACQWWLDVLRITPERSIAKRTREVVSAWSDAPSTQGLGAFYISETQTPPLPQSAFAITLPSHLANINEHINTQATSAVEQVLLHWGALWKHKHLIIHTDNQVVAHGLTNETIRGAPMRVLRRCLLLAAEYDLDLEARWISTKDNALADALSCFDLNRIADLAPQLLAETCSLQSHGFLIYGSQDSP